MAFEDGRLVRLIGEAEQCIVQENGHTWHRLIGQAETWSSYHRGQLPIENWKFGWCYGAVSEEGHHGVDDMHQLTYRGEFWVRYDEAWQASCCKFFIYPHFLNRYGREIDKGSASLVSAGQTALKGIQFSKRAT